MCSTHCCHRQSEKLLFQQEMCVCNFSSSPHPLLCAPDLKLCAVRSFSTRQSRILWAVKHFFPYHANAPSSCFWYMISFRILNPEQNVQRIIKFTIHSAVRLVELRKSLLYKLFTHSLTQHKRVGWTAPLPPPGKQEKLRQIPGCVRNERQ